MKSERGKIRKKGAESKGSGVAMALVKLVRISDCGGIKRRVERSQEAKEKLREREREAKCEKRRRGGYIGRV